MRWGKSTIFFEVNDFGAARGVFSWEWLFGGVVW